MPTVKTTRRLTANHNSPVLSIPRFMVEALGWEPKKTDLLISLTDEGLNVRAAKEIPATKEHNIGQ